MDVGLPTGLTPAPRANPPVEAEPAVDARVGWDVPNENPPADGAVAEVVAGVPPRDTNGRENRDRSFNTTPRWYTLI